jgi:hypothetical protein
MDPQKRFLASTLQGALDADVLTRADLFRHMSAEILARYVPPEILWEVITVGMRRSALGINEDSSASVSSAMPATPVMNPKGAETSSAPENSGDGESDVDTMFAGTTGQSSDDEENDLPFEISDDEMPPIPDHDAVVVEDVDWDDDDDDKE